MITCKKTYRDIPFANRQHKHTGHCSFIHGHNWTITIIFACKELNKSGFVMDFGNLGEIKEWIATNLDHAFVFNADDPYKNVLLEQFPQLFKAYTVQDSSCEGLAQHFYEVFNAIVSKKTNGRAFIQSIEVAEDSKNSATFTP